MVEAIPERMRNFNWQKNIWNLHTAPKTITHVLRDCEFARQAWNLAPLRSPSSGNSALVLDFLAQLPSLVSLPPVVISKAILDAKAWQEAQLSLPKPSNPHQPITSLPPPLRNSCMVDAAWHPESKNCGMGIIFMANMEEPERRSSHSRRLVTSALAAEAWAIWESLIISVDHGFDEIQVLSDSQVLVNLLNSQEMHTDIHAIVTDIRLLALSFSVISFSYVPRSLVAEADMLAKEALQTLMYLHD
ncbi:hypothetical protein EUTSA_v10005465mg [Eutrema salsugineum]|uniref:RNase H type-1 domain-containing protein n=1 Tax=Eutrema salsugineum TaxID=72664 RepID=V4MNS1_EUTSA|nr:hypothetical protein EUTSA_v10005465mg [Eutrema salsugineum]